jgi:hypothetical protein
VFDVGVMLVAGIAAYVLEENGFPSAPAILGVVLGGMLEDNLVSSLIKSDGNALAFFGRPIAAALGVMTILIWLSPLIGRWRRARKRGSAPGPGSIVDRAVEGPRGGLGSSASLRSKVTRHTVMILLGERDTQLPRDANGDQSMPKTPRKQRVSPGRLRRLTRCRER